jgi:hypothetical protein
MVKGVGCQGSRAGVTTWIAADQAGHDAEPAPGRLSLLRQYHHSRAARRLTCRPPPPFGPGIVALVSYLGCQMVG